MRLLGVALSGAGLPFISAKAVHRRDGSSDVIDGEVVCETQNQCDAVAAWAERDGWSVTTRLATADEVEEAKRWSF